MTMIKIYCLAFLLLSVAGAGQVEGRKGEKKAALEKASNRQKHSKLQVQHKKKISHGNFRQGIHVPFYVRTPRDIFFVPLGDQVI